MTETRVAVTGMGVLTPIGIGVEPFWASLLAGRSGIGPIEHFDASGLPARIAAYVRDGAALERCGHRLGVGSAEPRSLLFALTVGQEAYETSGWHADLGGERVGVVFGSYGDKIDIERTAEVAYRSRYDGAPEIVPSAFFPRYCRDFRGRQLHRLLPQYATVRLARMYRATGPLCTIQTACTSSAQAIGEAFRAIRRGTVDRAICGGAECIVSPSQMLMFSILGALSTRNDEPTRASRPFDEARDGFVLGEGGAVLTLERLDLARQRGAPILCELAGYGTACDAYRLTDEDPEGRGAILAMERALADAGTGPGEVDYISAHGTSTQMNDRVETLAIKTLLGPRAYHVPVSSIKSMIGHTVSAAGAIEAVACILALRDQMVPPTTNQESPDPQCDLDYVPNVARPAPLDTALSNSFGFGGHNDCLVFRRFRE
jgi:3-oxoacyl-[acyl-carrier-protein] synthase II